MSNVFYNQVEEFNRKLDPLKVLSLINYKMDSLVKFDDYLLAFCPIHKDTIIKTLKVFIPKNTFVCTYKFCKGHDGGNLVELYAYAKGLPIIVAMEHLATEFALELPETLQEYISDKEIEEFRKKLKEDPEEAFKKIKKLYSEKPDNLSIAFLYLEGLYLTGREEEFGRLKQKLQNVSESEYYFQKTFDFLLSVYPEDERLLKEVIIFYRNKQGKDRLINTLQKLAEIYIKKGFLEKAIHCYKEIIFNDPFNLSHRERLANLYLENKKNKEALAEYLKLYDTVSEKGDFNKKIEILKKSIELFPSEVFFIKEYLRLLRISKNEKEYEKILFLLKDKNIEEFYNELQEGIKVFRENVTIIKEFVKASLKRKISPEVKDLKNLILKLLHTDILTVNEKENLYRILLENFKEDVLYKEFFDFLYSVGKKEESLKLSLKYLDELFEKGEIQKCYLFAVSLSSKFPNESILKEKIKIIEKRLYGKITKQKEKDIFISKESSIEEVFKAFLKKEKSSIIPFFSKELIICDYNRLPYLLLKKIVSGDSFSPFCYFYGNLGLGKTHLISYFLKNIKKYVYFSFENFFVFFSEEVKKVSYDFFIKELGKFNVIVIDDGEAIINFPEIRLFFTRFLKDIYEEAVKKRKIILYIANTNILNNINLSGKLQEIFYRNLVVPILYPSKKDEKKLLDYFCKILHLTLNENVLKLIEEAEKVSPLELFSILNTVKIAEKNKVSAQVVEEMVKEFLKK